METKERLQMFAALGLSALGLACAATQPSTQGLSVRAVVLDVPPVLQDELYACGLASLTGLCQYWSVEIPVEMRLRLSDIAAREHGLSGDELISALDRLGMESYLFRGSLDRGATGLYRHIDAGRPPLVMLSQNGSTNHYSLVLGYDEPSANLVLLDPARGQVVSSLANFERMWARCERFTLLAAPRADLEGMTSGRPEESSAERGHGYPTSRDHLRGNTDGAARASRPRLPHETSPTPNTQRAP